MTAHPKTRFTSQILLLLSQLMFVSAKDARAEEPASVSFRRDVMPVFFRAGCNSGTCHGAARGKDGFHLSLFGYDPKGDYFRITQQMIGRRVNVAVPEQSLLLKKAIGAVAHSGGKRFAKDSEYYHTVLRWVAACLLYTSDAADEGVRVDLGGRSPGCLLYTSPSPRDEL